MSETFIYRHSETGAVTEQPRSAQAILANSGWFPLPAADVAALEQATADEVAAAEQAMRERGDRALGLADPATAAEAEQATAPPAAEKDAGSGRRPATKGND